MDDVLVSSEVGFTRWGFVGVKVEDAQIWVAMGDSPACTSLRVPVPGVPHTQATLHFSSISRVSSQDSDTILPGFESTIAFAV